MRRYRHILISLMAVFSAVSSAYAQTWEELSGDITGKEFTAGGYYKLVGNASTSSFLTISNSITLDLNGHTLVHTGSQQVFQIKAYGHTITIIDSNPNASNTGNFGIDGESVTINGGVIHAKGATRGGIIYISGGHLILEGGTLAGGKTTEHTDPVYNCGGGVYVDNGAFTMNGGHIAYCQTTPDNNSSKGGAVFINGQSNSSATFTMTGSSSIYGCKSDRGGAVYVHTNAAVTNLANNQGYFEMDGGVIENCSAKLGGAVMITSGSYFKMNDGEIRSNTCTALETDQYWGGGGIFVHYTSGPDTAVGCFDMYGGKITGNTSGSHGCGIHSNGTVNIYGGEISGNIPTGWSEGTEYDEGKGVYGGGIYMYEYSGYPSKLTINGTGSRISDNVAACGGGIYLNNGAEAVLSTGSVEGNRALTTWAEETDTEGVTVKRTNGGGGVFVSSGSVFTMSGGSLSGNKTSGFGNAVNTQGTFALEGGSITGNSPSDWAGGETYTKNTHGGGVCVVALPAMPMSRFTMTGGDITGNVGASGGGVMIWKNAQFDMSDGTISGNKAIGTDGLGNGGAVYVNSSTCTFNFNGGTITGNSSLRYGGAININQGSTLNLTSGTISGNTSGHGGGISQEQGECSMTVDSGITLSDNTARYDGGGLFVEMGKVTLNGCKISNNTATSGNGGGVALKAARVEGSIVMGIEGWADISNNTAGSNGGGIALHLGPDSGSWNALQKIQVNLTSGNIKNNTASSGGALHIYADPTYGTASMTVGNANLSENKASKKGGCIYINGSLTVNEKLTVKDNIAGEEAGAILVNGGNLVIADCDITGNKAGYDSDGNLISATAANGGAISIADGSVTITKGVISDNICTGYGGGLFVNNTDSEVIKTIELLGGGTFRNNRAQLGGGLYVSGNIDMTFQGNVAFNIARCGGGILLDGSKLTIKGGIIRNNRAVPDPSSPDAGPDNSKKPETGYQTDVSDLTGIGGGIYLNTGSTLSFDIKSELGVYENDATWGADDIFANGKETKVSLPVVTSMTLTGYRVPTTELYWAEDYITDDPNYGQGTKINTDWDTTPVNSRYDDAILDPAKYTIYKIDGGLTESDKYISLEIGYAYVIIDIIKQGLKKGESAVIILTPATGLSGDDHVVKEGEQPYLTIIFTGKEDGSDVTKQVVLPSGWWQMEETGDWAWAYDIESDADNYPKQRIVEITLDKQDDAPDGNLVYTFKNVRKEKNSIPETFESIVVNRMKSAVKR